ncbi:MAG: hypothetical protein AAGA56_12995, partial [Myxococcota bacterium]
MRGTVKTTTHHYRQFVWLICCVAWACSAGVDPEGGQAGVDPEGSKDGASDAGHTSGTGGGRLPSPGGGTVDSLLAVVSDSRDCQLDVSFPEPITVSDARGFRLVGGAARIEELIAGSGSNTLTFSLTDCVLPDDEFTLLYWQEIGDAMIGESWLAGFEDHPVENETTEYYGDGTIYYVSTSGDDAASGTSREQPFQSIEAAVAKLEPGDFVLLKRGDTFDDQNIVLDTSGTVDGYVTMGAYGAGERPIIHSRGARSNYKGYGVKGATVSVRGDYIHVDNIHVVTDLTNGDKGTDDGIQLLDARYPIVSNCTVEAPIPDHGNYGIRINTWVYGDEGREEALFNNT